MALRESSIEVQANKALRNGNLTAIEKAELRMDLRDYVILKETLAAKEKKMWIMLERR